MIWKLVKWVFWNVWYWLRTSSKELDGCLAQFERTRWPWWQFKPTVWHNDDGNQWEVCLRDEQDFSDLLLLPVDCRISMETGNIIGVTIWDEMLADAQRHKRWNPQEFLGEKIHPAD